MTRKQKRIILLNLPYVFIGLIATNLGEAWRISSGTNATERINSLMRALPIALEDILPSFHPFDMLVGIIFAAVFRLAVYLKGRNAKKYRHGEEYGSARWGKPQDIEPFMAPKFEDNVILTQTERLMLNSRPKIPKYARNKNVLVVGDNVIIGLSPSDFRKRGSHGGLVHICLRR